MPYSQMVLRLLMALVLGVGLSLLYDRTHRDDRTKASFLRTLILLPMVSGTISLVIGNHLVRAFGLLGAVALVRFRTVIKDTLDMAFVFIAIALGMACGTALYALGASSLALFAGSLLFMNIVRYGKGKHSSESYVVSVTTDDITRASEFLGNQLHDLVVSSHLEKAKRKDHTAELSYRMVLCKGTNEEQLLARLNDIDPEIIRQVQVKKD